MAHLVTQLVGIIAVTFGSLSRAELAEGHEGDCERVGREHAIIPKLDVSVLCKPGGCVLGKDDQDDCKVVQNPAYLNEMDIPTTTQLRVHPTPTHTLMFAWMRRNTTAAQKTTSRPLIIE